MAQKCTILCTAKTQCPLGFDCSQATADDQRLTCHLPTYDTTPASQGGFGADCSLYSMDVNGKQCDPNAENPCAAGFRCHADVKCDVNAFCSHSCTVDQDCPPNLFCGTVYGAQCTTDDNCTDGFTCSSNGWCKSQECIKRTYCLPCSIDDQCETGSVCATSPSGERYCATVCNDQTNCPHAPRYQDPDTGKTLVGGRPFTVCSPDLTSRTTSVSVCAPRSGYCHGLSNAAGVTGVNTVCSGCRTGMKGDCGSGMGCYVDPTTTESFCTQDCTVDLESNAGGWQITEGTDTCQTISPYLFCNFEGYLPDSCSGTATTCQASGYCAGDPARMVLTCYGCVDPTDPNKVNQCKTK